MAVHLLHIRAQAGNLALLNIWTTLHANIFRARGCKLRCSTLVSGRARNLHGFASCTRCAWVCGGTERARHVLPDGLKTLNSVLIPEQDLHLVTLTALIADIPERAAQSVDRDRRDQCLDTKISKIRMSR